jgi:ribonuclease HI
MLIYNISLYSWPTGLIKEVEKNIRNFIWSGDVDKRKLVTTSWKKVCRPLAQGGLNIRSISNLNKATNLKMCWSLMNSQCSWARLLKDRVIRGNKPIQHHIYSSIWSSIKDEFSIIIDNSIWLLGNGENINFWNDNWSGTPLSELFNIPPQVCQSLSSKVSDYILNGQWNIPFQLCQTFNNISNFVHQVTIPADSTQDKLLWKHSDSSDLLLKDAYNFKLQQVQDLHWAKSIWSSDIQPSKSLFVWKLMHNKVPTDENLMLRGCALPSMCSLCNKQGESTFHIFFECEFAVKIWSWFASCLNLVLQFTSIEDMWKICDMDWSPQCKEVIRAAMVNLLNCIWMARNQARFINKGTNWRSAISFIIANTSLTGNNTKKRSSNSIRDFSILKTFKVNIHHPNVPVIREIFWHPPLLNWTKCNIDGACSQGLASCSGVFRNHEAEFMLCFAEPLGTCSPFQTELCAAMRAIELAHHYKWKNIWLESDSLLVVSTFTNRSVPVSWNLRNRWHNILILLNDLNCIVSHIHREGNTVADLLAAHGLHLPSFSLWLAAPEFIKDSLAKNHLGLPNFRFCPT